MSSLRAHTLKQQVSLPVACLFVFVQTASQFFELPTCWGLNDGRARRGQRLSGSPGTAPRLPTEDLLGHLGHALFGLHRLSPPTRVVSYIVTLQRRTPAEPRPNPHGRPGLRSAAEGCYPVFLLRYPQE